VGAWRRAEPGRAAARTGTASCTAPSPKTRRVAGLLTGGVHIATNIPPQDAGRVEAAAGVRVAPWPTPRIMPFLMNTDDAVATGDKRVREAIDYAIDNELLIEALMDGIGTPVRGRVSPGITAAPMSLYGTSLYDPERAVELLAEAGYDPGELSIRIDGPAGRYPKDTEIVELTAIMLEAVGIEVEMQVLEWSAYLSRVWDADAVEHMALIGLSTRRSTRPWRRSASWSSSSSSRTSPA
jgi:peptide/nickel transport system substrate-binding protein